MSYYAREFVKEWKALQRCLAKKGYSFYWKPLSDLDEELFEKTYDLWCSMFPGCGNMTGSEFCRATTHEQRKKYDDECEKIEKEYLPRLREAFRANAMYEGRSAQDFRRGRIYSKAERRMILAGDTSFLKPACSPSPLPTTTAPATSSKPTTRT